MNSNSSPFDFFHNVLFKEYAFFFATPIARLANPSFCHNTFPSMLKTGCVRPLLKKPGLNIDDPENYRPVTILGTFSKNWEKLALEQLRARIFPSPNFSICQSAYRSFHSTKIALNTKNHK